MCWDTDSCIRTSMMTPGLPEVLLVIYFCVIFRAESHALFCFSRFSARAPFLWGPQSLLCLRTLFSVLDYAIPSRSRFPGRLGYKWVQCYHSLATHDSCHTRPRRAGSLMVEVLMLTFSVTHVLHCHFTTCSEYCGEPC